MGAGPQSYLNPLGYVPFYFLVKAGTPSIVIAALYACVHALNLALLWAIGWIHLFSGSRQRMLLSIAGALLGGLSPVFIAMVGGLFLDPILSVLALAAILALLESTRRPNVAERLIFVAGLLLGMGAGLKLVLAIYCVAAAVCLSIQSRTIQQAFRHNAVLLVGGVSGFLLSGGWWAWEMALQFGNPVFPLFNGVFQSPHFPAVSLSHDRFLPQGLIDYVLLPLRMMKMHSGVYVEILAPDIRLFLFQVGLLTGLLVLAVRRHRSMPHAGALPQAFWVLFVFAGLAWLLNQGTSGNGRYAVTSLLLTGPLLVSLSRVLLQREANQLLLVAIVGLAQFLHAYKAGYPRWDTAPWTRNWFDVAIPESHQVRPFGYLWVNTSNPSAVMPFLAPGSGSLTLHGFEPLSPDGPGSLKANEFLKYYAGRLRVLISTDDEEMPAGSRSITISPELKGATDRLLAPWDLQVIPEACEQIRFSTNGPKAETMKSRRGTRQADGFLMASCQVAKGSYNEPGMQEARAKLTIAFDRVSATCPLLFPPPGGYPYKYGAVWVKRFSGTDTILAALDDKLIYSKYPFGPFNVPLGNVDAWVNAPQLIDCRRQPRPW